MGVELVIEPGIVKTWSAFRKESPPRSIALDGYVNGPTRRDLSRLYANYNHHNDSTGEHTTCAQVYLEIGVGLFKRFSSDGQPHAHVYVNDPDHDTSTAVALLRNPAWVYARDPRIEQLVLAENLRDCTAGGWRIASAHLARQMTWMYEPYTLARNANRVKSLTGEEMRAIIDAICDRIAAYKDGRGGEIDFDGSYEVLHPGDRWALVRETGPGARIAMGVDGISAHITFLGQRPDGMYDYAVRKESSWEPAWRQRVLYRAFNRAEPPGLVTPTNRWDGSKTIGGSPRGTGSANPPARIVEIVERILQKRST